MSESQLILLNSNAPERVCWGSVADAASGQPISANYGTLADAAQQARGKPTIVLLDDYITLSEITLPNANEQRVRQAVPFALEEDIIEDVGSLHFSLSKRLENNRYLVAITAKAQMDALLDLLQSAGIFVREVVPACLTVPWEPDNGWSMICTEQHALLRTGTHSGMTIDINAIDAFLTCLLPSTTKQRITYYKDATAPTLNLPSDRVVLDERPHSDVLDVLSGGLRPATVNLLQGEYAQRRSIKKGVAIWRQSAVLFAVWLAIWLCSQVLDYRSLSQREQLLDEQTRAVLAETFPGISNIQDPVARMREKLASLTDGNADFLQNLAYISEGLSESSILKIHSLNYRKGQFDLEVSVPQLQLLDSFQKHIDNSPQLTGELVSASRGENQITARVKIKQK